MIAALVSGSSSADCHFVRSGRGLKPMAATSVDERVIPPSLRKSALQTLLRLPLPPPSLQRFAL